MVSPEDLRNRRATYCKALDHSLEEIVKQLAAIPEVEKVILFGSYAGGRRDLFTDLDLMVIMESKQDFVSRTAALYRKLRVAVDMDLVVYTPQELERRKDHGFIRHILRTGRVVYERGSTGGG